MKLTILGSGTMMPTKNRYPSAYLVEEGDTKLLLDCGHLTIARLIERGIDLRSITAVGITHFHTDHFSNLLPLVHARWVDDRMQQKEHKPLTIFGPAMLEERYRKLREVMWPEPSELYAVNFVEGTGSQQVGKLALLTFPIQHVPWFPSVGFKITASGKSLVYTGDLNEKQGDEFFTALTDADLLLIEAGSIKAGHGTHLTPQQAIEWAKQYRVKKVVLTHLRPSAIATIHEVAATEPELVTVADDGLVINLS